MAERHVVTALRRKYAELKGVLKHLPEQDPEPTLIALRQVGCVLRMFSPTEDLSAVAPVRPHKPDRARLWTRSAMDVLRVASAPLTTRQIARRVAEAHEVHDDATLFSIECSLHATLPRRPWVKRLDGSPKRWRVAI
jgi:hypothetical protein